MEGKAKILRRFFSDVLVLGAGGIILLLFKVAGSPFKRGFFCDDESLMHPFHDSTVTSGMLYGIGFAIAIVLILIIESVLIYKPGSAMHPRQRLDINQYGNLPVLIRNCYLAFVPFCFGAITEHITTDIGKYSIGRLRPHFFDVCNLNMSQIDCRKGYIEDFDCTGDPYRVKEVRLSFPSGHASFSTFVAVYMMIYLQKRMTFVFPSLLRPVLQMLVFSLAWYTCLSRVSDYKHHWSDVLGGIVVGAVAAIIVAYCVSDLFKENRRITSGGNMGNSLPRGIPSEASIPEDQFREISINM